MAEAAAAGLTVVALTDHDTTAGWAGAAAALPPGRTLVPGAELSCRLEGDRPLGVHLLAYLFDPDEPVLRAERVRVREGRRVRARRMVDLLAADGWPVTWEQVESLAGGGTVGRPHLGRALLEHGLVADMEEAFSPQWLGRGGPYHLAKEEMDLLAAVGMVRAAGGVPVLAHPGTSRRGPAVPDQAIEALAAAGLAGLEVDHPDHDRPQRARLRGLAGALGLLATGSSDYHGSSKPVRLGAEVTDEASYAALVEQGSGTGIMRG